MRTKKNRYGLNRTIPADIKRVVRQNAGFGCVICGNAFCHYEHYNPEFKDAKEHTAEGITLLCYNHHNRKTTKKISIETILKAVENPKCLEQGFSHDELEFGHTEPKIQVGNYIFYNPKSIITINGESIFSILPPENDNGPFRLTFITDNKKGNKIVENEWFGDSQSWDIRTEGNKIIVFENVDKKILEFENILGEKFKINHIDIVYKGFKVRTQKIRPTIFGDLEAKGDNIFIIQNPQGIEIFRATSFNTKTYEFHWEHAIDIKGEFVETDFSGASLNGGKLNFGWNPNNPIVFKDVIIKDTEINLGLHNDVIKLCAHANAFSKILKQVNFDYTSIPKEIRNDLLNQIKFLNHTLLINQLRKNEIEWLEMLKSYIIKSLK